MAKRRGIGKLVEKTEVRVNGFAAGLACVLSVGISGYLGIQNADLDDGKVVTAAEMYQRLEQEKVRIQNDPHIPPKFKAFALNALNRGSVIGHAPVPGER